MDVCISGKAPVRLELVDRVGPPQCEPNALPYTTKALCVLESAVWVLALGVYISFYEDCNTIRFMNDSINEAYSLPGSMMIPLSY